MYEREIGLIDDIFKHIIGFDTDVIVAWQTLKAAVLAQQTNNSAMVPCQHKFFSSTEFGFVECKYCGATYPIEAQHQ